MDAEVQSLEWLEFSEAIPCDSPDHGSDKEKHDDGEAKWYTWDLCPTCGHSDDTRYYAICDGLAQWFMGREEEGMCVCGLISKLTTFRMMRRIDEPFD